MSQKKTPNDKTPKSLHVAAEGVSPPTAAKYDGKTIHDAKREIKTKIANGEYELMKKVFKDGGNHDVWRVFRLVVEAQDKKRLGWVMCVQCNGVQVYKDVNGVTALLRHLQACAPRDSCSKASDTLFAPPNWAVQEFKRAQAKFCALDLRPPHAFYGAGMQELLETAISIGSKCGRVSVPRLRSCPTTVATCIKEEADKARAAMMPEIRLAMKERRMAATMDGFTHDQTKDHFLTFTIHYVSAGWTSMCRTLFTMSMPPDFPATALNVRDAMHHNLESMGLQKELLKGTGFVTDGGKDVVNAVSPYRRLYCIGHGYNIILCTTLSVKYASIVSVVLQKCPEAEFIIAQCNQWIYSVRKALPTGCPILKGLKCSQPTLESHLPPLLSYSVNRLKVQDVLAQRVPAIDVNDTTLLDLINFLKPLDLAGTRETSPTMSPKRYDLMQVHFQPEVTDSVMVRQLKCIGMDELVIMEVVMAITQCKETVAYLNRSGFKNRLEKTTKQACETRWNTHRDMLVSLENQWEEIHELLGNQENCEEASPLSRANAKRQRLCFHAIDRTLVADLSEFLTPFEAHSRKLQGKSYPTLPYEVMAQRQLLDHCSFREEDSPVMKAIRRKAARLLLEKVPIEMEHKMTVFLWPRYKELAPFPTQAEKEEIYTAVREYMKENLEEEDGTPSESSFTSPPSASSSDVGIREPESEASSSSSCKKLRLCLSDEELYGSFMVQKEMNVDEVEKYKRMTQSETGDDSNVLKWWAIQGISRFPKLAKVARHLLAIPATAAASEFNFSELGELISSGRASMLPSTANDTLVWRDFLKNKSNH